jgi:rare lipoprotein A (peptidoglycan hydrolase)
MFRGFTRLKFRAFSFSALIAALAVSASPVFMADQAEAKTPGKTYCYKGTCHQVKTLAETAALIGRDENLTASFYDDCKVDRFNPCGLTSSGEKFRPNDADNAASPIYPDGTVVLLWNEKNGQAAVVRINNAGPYWGKRKIDVSRATAEKLGFKKRGVAKLAVRVISAPDKAEARYKKNRRYDAVPGELGRFASLDSAAGGAVLAMAGGKTETLASVVSKLPPLPGASGTIRTPLNGARFANADTVPGQSADISIDGETPADGLRAAARRTFGLDPEIRRVAPSTLTAEALYGRIRTAL